MLKKKIALLMCLCILVTMSIGCSSKEKDEPTGNTTSNGTAEQKKDANDSNNKETIKVAVWDKATIPYYDELSALFTSKYPDITVEYIDVASTEYTNKLAIMLNGGSDLDTFFIKDADTSMSLYQKEQLENLQPYVEKDNIDLAKYNGLADNFAFDNGLYGVPFRTDYYVLYYNKDIFDAANEPYPTNDMTWDEFEAKSKRITTGEGADRVYGGYFHTWNACIQNWSVQDGKHTIIAKDYSFMKPYYDRALRMQNEDKTIMEYATLKTSNIHYSGVFYNAQVGMLPMGTWLMNGLIEKKEAGETNINWGVATLPHASTVEAGYTVGSATPIAMNAKSKHKDAAWKFIQFITSDEAATFLASKGVLPSMLTKGALEHVASAKGMPEGIVEALQVKNIALDRPIAQHVREVNKILGEEHGLIMFGEKTVEQGLDTMAKRVAELIK